MPVEVEHAVAERLVGAVLGERGVELARHVAERAHDARRGRSRAQSRCASSSAAGSVGVLPPSTMFAISGSAGAERRRPSRARSSRVRGASTNSMSAPASRYIAARSMARSKPSTATASVRAMISVSRECRASTAARILPHISSRRDQRLAVEMAAALGKILVLELDRVGAGALELAHRAHHVERVAVAGVGIDDQMRADAVADQRQRLGHLGHGDEADVGPAELGVGDRRAGDIERREARPGSRPAR